MALETDKQRGFAAEFQELWASIPSKAAFGILFAAWFALFHFLGNSTFGYFKTPSIFRWLYEIYKSAPDDSLGTLIPFAVFALLWWKREALIAAPKKVWWPALAVFALAVGFHLIGYAVQQTRVSLVAFFVGLYALMGLVWGPAWLRATFFPFVLFAFMVPMNAYAENLTTSLRQLSTVMTVAISDHVLGIEVHRTGTQIFDKSGRFQYEVAAACSGIRSLTMMTALATVVAFMGFQKTWKRVLVIGAAIPLSVIGNMVRLLSIIVAAEWRGQAAGAYVHENWFFSLFPYVPAIVALMLMTRLLGDETLKEAKA